MLRSGGVKGLGADHCAAALLVAPSRPRAVTRARTVHSARRRGANGWCGRAGWRPHHVQNPASGNGQCDLVLCFNLRRQRDIHVIWTDDLPLFCVLAPSHPLADQQAVSLADVRKHAIVVQSRTLSIRRMLDERHSWVFEQGAPPVVTNSLQLLKQLAAAGGHVSLTSEMDAAPELLSGALLALPVTGPNLTSQSISVAVNARRTLPRITNVVAKCLGEVASETLHAVRFPKTS